MWTYDGWWRYRCDVLSRCCVMLNRCCERRRADYMMQVRNHRYDRVRNMLNHREPRSRHSGRIMLLRSDCLLPGWCLMLWMLWCKWIGTGKLTLPLRLYTWWGQVTSIL